jgi:hypothetical protein
MGMGRGGGGGPPPRTRPQQQHKACPDEEQQGGGGRQSGGSIYEGERPRNYSKEDQQSKEDGHRNDPIQAPCML